MAFQRRDSATKAMVGASSPTMHPIEIFKSPARGAHIQGEKL